MPSPRALGAAVLAAIAIAIAVPALAQSRAADPPPGVVVARARLAEFVDRVEALGTTRARESVEVTSSVTEKAVEIRFDDGQEVAAGDVLVVLEDSEQRADLEAVLAVREARRLSYERALQLERRKVAATAQLDERRAALRQAEAEIEAIRSRIADRTIRAPFGGIVGLRNISVGALVEPGDLITTLDDISEIKLDFTVPATFLSTLEPGLEIRAGSSAFPGRTFEGVIASVDSRVDPVTRSIVARAIVPNPDRALRPGLLMTVELLKNPRQAIVVPESAIIPRGRTTMVYVVDAADGGRIAARPVEIGTRRPGEVEIRSGLGEGELVVVRGTMQVRPGQRVTVMADEPGAAPSTPPMPPAPGG